MELFRFYIAPLVNEYRRHLRSTYIFLERWRVCVRHRHSSKRVLSKKKKRRIGRLDNTCVHHLNVCDLAYNNQKKKKKCKCVGVRVRLHFYLWDIINIFFVSPTDFENCHVVVFVSYLCHVTCPYLYFLGRHFK